VAGSDGDGPVLLTVQEDEVTERRVDGGAPVVSSALSPDGGTVYLGLAPVEERGEVGRLVAVDAASGEVTAEVPLGDGLDPRARAYDLLPREVSVGMAEDGDLVVLTGVRGGRQVSVFSAGELRGTVDADFTGPVEAVVAGPSDGRVTLAWGRGGADPVVVTLDPATGELGEPLDSCESLGGHDALDLAPDGSWGVTAGSCGDSDVVAVLVG
jgi:hypothetical protein